MPKIRHARSRKPPEGFDEVEPTLQEFAQKMKDGKVTTDRLSLKLEPYLAY
jgi:hypothetical protein